MATNSQSGGQIQITGLLATMLIVPALLYPAFYGAALIFDTFLGEQQVLHHILEQSKRFVWDAFWGDWQASLLFSYGVVLPLLGGVYWLSVRRGLNALWLVPSIFIVGAVLISVLLTQGRFAGVVLLTALLLALPASAGFRIFRS